LNKISLSDGEWKIMNLLWHSSPKTITAMTNELRESTGWTRHIIITMLNRLEAKGAVYNEEGERAKLYFPLVEQTETVLKETETFLEKVYSGSLGLMLNTMVQKQGISQEELSELYAILKKAEEGGKSK